MFVHPFFKHKDTCPITTHKAILIVIKGSRGFGWIIVAPA